MSAMYCSQCGKEIINNEEVCSNCGYGNKSNAQINTGSHIGKKTKAAIIGIIGLVCAWNFAHIGHVVSIIGIVCGVKEYKECGKTAGLILCIISEVCAVISSLSVIMERMG